MQVWSVASAGQFHGPKLYFFYTMVQKSQKMTKNSNQGVQGGGERERERERKRGKGQDPLEAILAIFGRRALIFFLFESSWKRMKNDTTFVRMRSGDHFGDAKMSKKGTSLRRIKPFY